MTNNELKKDFLIELGCEELPASSLVAVAQAFQNNIEKQLNALDLPFEKSELFYTPRRIAVRVKNLIAVQPARTMEKQGPHAKAAFDKEGNLTAAGLGFLKSAGVSINEMSRKTTEKGEYLVCTVTLPSVPTETVLFEIVETALKTLPIPKPMRWANHEFTFLRPVHWVVMLFGETVIPGELFGKQTNRITYGHRFLAPQAISLKNPADYIATLEKGFVVADAGTRRATIEKQMQALALPKDSSVLADEELLDQVNLLVEWPVTLVATFSEHFLKVPKEALMTSMKSHQKCFSVIRKNGELENAFVLVSNIESKNKQSVITGNERVMRARLTDAAFFYEQDLKTPLIDHLEKLNSVVFQQGLGSMRDKANRLSELTAFIMDRHAAHAARDDKNARRAGQLAKCDLLTHMVGEFPELQGIMGEYYARANGENTEVAVAIREQYLPRFSGDALPKTELGAALALADRVDTLVGMIGIGKKPTGDKDPLGLRRAALGVIRILLERKDDLDLSEILAHSFTLYHSALKNPATISDAVLFLADRLKVYTKEEKNISTKTFNAALTMIVPGKPADGIEKPSFLLKDFMIRLINLEAFIQDQAKEDAICSMHKRVLNLNTGLAKSCRDGIHPVSKAENEVPNAQTIDTSLFENDTEKKLYSTLLTTEKKVDEACAKKNYEFALNLIVDLKPTLDAFCDSTLVISKDEKILQNRKALFGKILTLFTSKVAAINWFWAAGNEQNQ